MKLNRSAIILAIAIVLLIVALFVVRSSDEGDDLEILTNASNATDISGNATNATQALTNATMPADNATMPADNATIFNATLEAQANATAENDRLAKEKAEKAAKEKAKKEKAAKEKASKEKAAKEKAAKEKAEQEKKDKSGVVGTAPTKPTTPAPKPSKPAGKPAGKPTKGSPPSEAVVSQLNDFGARRISLINSSIRPSKSSREVTKQGKEYVARYYYVAPTSLRTEATAADSSSPFIYVGKVRYQECLYECRASSKEEAMRGEGQIIQSRNMLELIRYTNKWTE